MAPEPVNEPLKTEELADLLRAIRERVAARYPQPNGAGSENIADLSPLVHARDAAEAKMAAIGSVNPRPPGFLNSLIQAVKRVIARGMAWFVRDQVVFNREVMACVEATIEAVNELNRSILSLSQRLSSVARTAEDLKDIRSHWITWRSEWERKLATNEIQFLRAVADLETAFQHRTALMETNFREHVKAQHADYLGALERTKLEMQKTLAADFARVTAEFQALIHTELRLIRQRASSLVPPEARPALPPAPVTEPVSALDYARFAERFRGSEEFVKAGQRFYVPYFAACKDVLDLGCGRGEFLELMRVAGVSARGIDLSRESVDLCRSKGLHAEQADLFAYLAALPGASLDGIFCAQVVEHLPPARLPEFIRLAAEKLWRGGVLVVETPNPECLAIFATHFYLDPTHRRPVHHALLAFYMEESGIGQIEIHRRSPALETMPALAALPPDFREAFFGGLDYGIVGRRI